MSKVDTILEEIKGLTLLEASDLVKKMEETFGVSAAAATVVAAGGGAAPGGAAPAEEKTEFSQYGFFGWGRGRGSGRTAPKEFAYASRSRYQLQNHGPFSGPPQPCAERSRAGRFARR